MLTQQQLNTLLTILNKHTRVLISSVLGPTYLTPQEVAELIRVGINPHLLYSQSGDYIFTAYQFGMLSNIMKTDAKKLKYNELLNHIESQEYLKPTIQEQAMVHSIKRQTLRDIKAIEGRIFNDINHIINDKENQEIIRQQQEEVIREHIIQGLLEQRTASDISREISRKTGDWSRNFGRIVEYHAHTAFEEGRAAMIQRQTGNKDQLVYKEVYPGACKHCIKLYLTAGLGSEPKLFKLSELKKNGNNINRKVNDWLPVITATHPHCRCMLRRYFEGSNWSDEKKEFVYDKPVKPKRKRPKVKVTINGKDYYG